MTQYKKGTSVYPPVQSDTYVAATTTYNLYYAPCFATEPLKSRTGVWTYNSWLAQLGALTNQRFHIDLGEACIIENIYYENAHDSGTLTASGIKNFTFWGSNSASDFADLVYANDGTWVQLATAQSTFDQHVAADQPDPKNIRVTNSTAYRYYAFKFADTWTGTFMGIRRIELQLNPNTISRWSGIISRLCRLWRPLSGSLTMSGEVLTRTFEVREMLVMGDLLYAVVGTKLYSINSSWQKTELGTIGTTVGKVWIFGDGNNICVVDGSKGYSWNGVTFAEISFPDAFSPSSLTFQDGYFIVSKDGTGRFYISGLNDPTTWNALDYATAEGLHDNLVAVHSHNRNLWLFGSESLEIWYNSGASNFPFERAQGGFINIGCKAPRSIVSSEGNIFWLDNTLRVRMSTGTESTIISTPQIEYQISQLPYLYEVVGFCYHQKGHGFYQLSIGYPGRDKTLVYDTTTKYWHTRATGEKNRRHPAQCYAFFNGKHLVGHWSRGHILELDYNTFTNNGESFKAIRAAQAIHGDRKRIFHKELEIEFESGVGVDADTDPEAILEWSDDGGHTWSSEHTATFGKLGEFSKRAIWRRLGNSRGRVYRVTIDDPVKRIIIGAHLEFEVGRL